MPLSLGSYRPAAKIRFFRVSNASSLFQKASRLMKLSRFSLKKSSMGKFTVAKRSLNEVSPIRTMDKTIAVHILPIFLYSHYSGTTQEAHHYLFGEELRRMKTVVNLRRRYFCISLIWTQAVYWIIKKNQHRPNTLKDRCAASSDPPTLMDVSHATQFRPEKESPLLEVTGLTVEFAAGGGNMRRLIAVDNVGFTLESGKTVCLVGESGCGKTMTALAIMGLLPEPGAVTSGSIRFEGCDLTKLSEKELRKIRGRLISMIFQEPMTALNPVLRIGNQISEVLILHKGLSKKAAWSEAVSLLRQVGIPAPEARAMDFPHQMSGGMRQRALIAMALACSPRLIVADEPTTALDVTIQRQILELIADLGKKYGTGTLLITHDLGIVAEVADTVLIMYAGKVVEQADAAELFSRPRHPYTQGLIKSRPAPPHCRKTGNTPERESRLEAIPGMVPALTDIPRGCAFRERCPKAMPACARQSPPFVEVTPGHFVRCRLFINDAESSNVRE